MLVSCMTSSHFAQKPGNGGRPAIATMKSPRSPSSSGRPDRLAGVSTSSWRSTPASQNNPALARRWLMNKPPTTSGIEAVAPIWVKSASARSHQAHLADRGVAKQALHFGLLQPDQIGEQEGDPAGDGDDAKLRLEQRQQFEEREEHARRDADRDERRNPARRRLVYVEAPAIGRERLQLDDQAGQDHQQRRRADRPGDLLSLGDRAYRC